MRQERFEYESRFEQTGEVEAIPALWLDARGQIDCYDDPALMRPAANAIARPSVEALGSSESVG